MQTPLATLTPLSLALLATIGTAQTVAFPSDFTSREGTLSERNRPLANGVARTQFLYDSRDLGVDAGKSITEVGFRQDNNTASVGKSIQLAIYMGGTTHDSKTLTTSFGGNYNGTARTLVFGPAIVTLPDFTAQTTRDEFWIKLDRSFRMPANENLLVEYVVTANNNANRAFNWYIDKGTFYSEAKTFGTACQTSSGQTPRLSASSNSYLGGNLSFTLRDAPASSQIWFNIDAKPTPPIDAGQFGAPGCTLYVQPLIAIPTRGSTSGTASFSFPTPADPSLFHITIYGQCAIFDLFANNLGFAFSNGAQVTMGMYPLATTVYANGSATASSGSVRRNDVPVSLFKAN